MQQSPAPSIAKKQLALERYWDKETLRRESIGTRVGNN